MPNSVENVYNFVTKNPNQFMVNTGRLSQTKVIYSAQLKTNFDIAMLK